MDSLTHEEILEVLDCILFHTTEKMTGMHIRSHPHDLSDDLCCVSARFEGSCELTLALYADRLFFRHLAQEIFQDPNITEDDISEAAREYLNVICGRLVGKVSKLITGPPLSGSRSITGTTVCWTASWNASASPSTSTRTMKA